MNARFLSFLVLTLALLAHAPQVVSALSSSVEDTSVSHASPDSFADADKSAFNRPCSCVCAPDSQLQAVASSVQLKLESETQSPMAPSTPSHSSDAVDSSSEPLNPRNCSNPVAMEHEDSLSHLQDYWPQLLAVVGLVLSGGIFAGLTIGLMSLDIMNLEILQRSGSKLERKYASAILPIRKNGHLLLVTLLLSNVIVNATLPIILDSIFGDGWQAIVITTILIVIFGEIIPQSLCTRYGLAIGANLAWLVRILIIVLFVFSWPISKLLDWIIGTSHGVIYRRSELKELVSLHGAWRHGELTQDEVTMIRGVIDLKDKYVLNVMTHLDDVFMLDILDVVDKQKLNEIVSLGHSRIPVYQGERENIIGMVLVKSLVPIDHTQPVNVSELPIRIMPIVDADVTLFDMINEFQKGNSHMAVVTITSSTIPPITKQVGIVTLEDIIEELIQEEIVDETDIFVNIASKVRVNRIMSDTTILIPDYIMGGHAGDDTESVSTASTSSLSPLTSRASSHRSPNSSRYQNPDNKGPYAEIKDDSQRNENGILIRVESGSDPNISIEQSKDTGGASGVNFENTAGSESVNSKDDDDDDDRNESEERKPLLK